MTTSTGSTSSPMSTEPHRRPSGDTVPPRDAPTPSQRQPAIHDTSVGSTDDERVPPTPLLRSMRGHDVTPNRGEPATVTSRSVAPAQTSSASALSPALAGSATPVPSARSPAAPSDARSHAPSARALLDGATRVELQHLLDTYDTEALPNGTRLSRSNDKDQQNATRMSSDLTPELTGYPPKVQRFEQQANAMQSQLATLPPAEHEAYAGALATLDVAYRNSSDDEGRQRVDRQMEQLSSAVLAGSGTALNDPVVQALSMFNQPVGAGYLSQPDDQRKLGTLAQLRDGFVGAATPAARQAYFTQAAELKNDLQHKIGMAIDQHTTQEACKWTEANAEVDRIIHEAEAVTGDPGKRYELIGRQLFSTNPGTGRDDLADRRLLAFTQRMQDDPGLHDKLTAWSVEAGRKLNDYGVDAPKSYLDILNNLPPAGPDYVRDLADQYNAVLHDTSYKDYSITPQARGEKLAEQILEGTARFLLGMTPFAPLTAVFDQHSSLPENARLGIDIASGALGLVAGEGAAAFAERLGAKSSTAIAKGASEGRTPEPPIPTGHDRITPPPAPSVEPGNAANIGGQHTWPKGDAGAQGLHEDAAVAEASQRINGEKTRLPDDYAVAPEPDALKPAPGQTGVLVDKHGQHYITSNGKTYPVRFDQDNRTWRAYQPDNAYRPQYPVRPDAHGDWQVHNDVGLKGGMDPQGAPHAEPGASHPFAERYQVATTSGAPPSADMLQTLDPASWHSPTDHWLNDAAFARRYKAAFEHLSDDQQRAIRSWTYLDTSDTYSTGSEGSGDINFELNQELSNRHHLGYTDATTATLRDALARLPKPEAESRLLRVADVPADYATRFAPGEYVTNSPAFMSASSANEYAEGMLADSDRGAGSGHAFALYDIQSKSASPFVEHVSTLALAEREWLFAPNTVFRVEEIATASSRDGTTMPRIGLRLTEVPISSPVYAKNIYTGEQELVYPQGTTPVYTPLQAARVPTLQVPPAGNPDLPPSPTHGNPNQPGPSTA